MNLYNRAYFSCHQCLDFIDRFNSAAFGQIKKELHATDSQIALSLAIYILVQGNAPLVWSAISEIKGRKIVYIVSMIVSRQRHSPSNLSDTEYQLFCIGSAISGTARNMNVLIGMRILQATGSSPVLSLGAGTLSVGPVCPTVLGPYSNLACRICMNHMNAVP